MSSTFEHRLHASASEAVASAPSESDGWTLIALGALLALGIVGSLTFGRYAISFDHLLTIATGGDACDPAMRTVFWQVRLPRVLAAVLIGGAMAVPGAAYQGIFKNPMASSEVVGATSGAAFGVAIGILLGLNVFFIQIGAFACGLAAVGLTLAITSIVGRGQDSILVLVLVGIMVGSVFMALVSAIKFLADPYSKLPAITFWLMGSLSSINPDDVRLILGPLCIGMVPLMLVRWRLNVLALGDEEARALGVNTGRLRVAVILCSTLMTASSVAVAGQVGGMGMGGIGLVIPHLTRLIVGPNYKILLPASALLGGLYLLLVDDLARTLNATELPLGVLTSLIGAPFFVVLLLRVRKGWA
jgi:iron complex transport system permease protein